MNKPLTVQLVRDTMCSDLSIRWLDEPRGGERILSREDRSASRSDLIGPFNFSTPHRIQVLGPAECELLNKAPLQSQNQPNNENQSEHNNENDLGQWLLPDQLDLILKRDTDLVLITDDQSAPAALLTTTKRLGIAVFTSPESYSDCINILRYRLLQYLAEVRVLHGVFMDVLGNGVLITGASGVGKSELALELISRGHILVADDATEFRRIAPDTIEGRCPELLQDFLEVRGLGILNIAQMYGHASTRRRKILKFIIQLQIMPPAEMNDTIDRSSDAAEYSSLLGVDIRKQLIAVAPGRNLAVLVEAAVRNYILVSSGYNATSEFISRQQQAMEADS